MNHLPDRVIDLMNHFPDRVIDLMNHLPDRVSGILTSFDDHDKARNEVPENNKVQKDVIITTIIV